MADEDEPDRSSTIDGYERLAARKESLDDWESPWADSPYQEHYVWPAVRPLLPDLAGTRVLDAGCGIGDYAGRFLEAGASVVGVDASENSLAVARDRYGDRATFRRGDLTEPLEFADADEFDLVFCNLVLDHVEDWEPVLEEFRRVLASGGVLVFAIIHPLRRYCNHPDELPNYHETRGYVIEWGNTDAELTSYYRPIGEIFDSLASAGFAVEEFREPTPEPEYEQYDPERYERASRRPDTLCVRARATGVGDRE